VADAAHEEGAQNLGEEGTKLLIGGDVKTGLALLAGFKVLLGLGAKSAARSALNKLQPHR
jgi:hypothetical protein